VDVDRSEELFQVLSPEYIPLAVARVNSLARVSHAVKVGIAKAYKEKRDEHLFRLALDNSILTELDNSFTARAEIMALISNDEHQRAIAIAQAATPKESKLELLAATVRALKEKKLTPGAEILDEIKKLYETIDRDSLRARAETLSEDLLYSYPDYALDLLKSPNPDAPLPNQEASIARLSIHASSLIQKQHLMRKSLIQFTDQFAVLKLDKYCVRANHCLRSSTRSKLLDNSRRFRK